MQIGPPRWPRAANMNGDLSLWQLVATTIGVIVAIVGTAVSIKNNLLQRPSTSDEIEARLTEIEQTKLPIIGRIVLLQLLAIIVMGVVLIRVAMN